MEGETIRIRRILPAKKERVFRAWTEPSEMKRWWTIGEGWKASSVEIDLRVGGRFSVRNEQTSASLLLITGEFLVVQPPDKLVYKWRFHTQNPEESLVTVEFRDLGDSTEVVVTQEHTSKEMEPSASAGWTVAFDSLLAMFAQGL